MKILGEVTCVVVLHTVRRCQEHIVFHEDVAACDVIHAVEREEQFSTRDKGHFAKVSLLGVGCWRGVCSVGQFIGYIHYGIGFVRGNRRVLPLRRPVCPDILRRLVEGLALKGEKIAVG